ncbi:MAG: N-acetyltransferase, partial [Verrucomicrobiaceae bacterium]
MSLFKTAIASKPALSAIVLGITSRAFSLVVDYCFEEFKFKKLFLRTHESNLSAQKLAEKSGFEMEG